MACLEHCVQPCMARKESALQDAQPAMRTMKSTNPMTSGVSSLLFSNLARSFCQVAPLDVHREEMIRGGKISSVSELYIIGNQ